MKTAAFKPQPLGTPNGTLTEGSAGALARVFNSAWRTKALLH
jgi:hypothetical protein